MKTMRTANQLFSFWQWKYRTKASKPELRCLDLACRFYGLPLPSQTINDGANNLPLNEKLMAIAHQYPLRLVQRKIESVNTCDLATPFLFITQLSKEFYLFIPSDRGKPLIYSANKGEFIAPKSDGCELNDVQNAMNSSNCFEILPSYQQSSLQLSELLVWATFGGNAIPLLLYGLLTLVVGVMMMLPALIMGYLINHVIGVADSRSILGFTFLLLVCAFSAFSAHLLRSVLMIRMQAVKRLAIVSGVFSRFLLFAMDKNDPKGAGEIQQGVNLLAQLVSQSIQLLMAFGSGLLFFFLSLGLLFILFWKLAFAQLLLAVFVALVMFAILWRKAKPLMLSVYQQSNSLNQCFDAVNHFENALILNKTTPLSDLCQQGVEQTIASDYQSYRYDVYRTLLSYFLHGFSLIVTFLLIYLGPGDQINLGLTVSFLSLSAMFHAHVLSLLQSLGQCFVLLIRYRKIQTMLDYPIKVPSSGLMMPIYGDIAIEHLYYRYPDGQGRVISDVNFSMAQGQKIAIVGHSGAGKTTIIKLLLSLLPDVSGSITIDGWSLSKMDIVHFQSQVGFLSSDEKLFNGSLRDNITLGCGYADEEIWAALAVAECDTTIKALPMKLNSIVSDNVAIFSDGERKRLLIARAIIRQPRIIFADEITSGLDPVTANKVMQKLMDIPSTGIFTSSDGAYLESVDCIYCLENGRFVESGTYQQLRQKNGFFYHQFIQH
jgi:ATP-binding cassette subfamily C protein